MVVKYPNESSTKHMLYYVLGERGENSNYTVIIHLYQAL